MRDLFGRLGKQTIVYGIGGAALQLVGLVTLPVYTRTFQPAQYGQIEVAMIGFTALLMIVDSGMTSAAQRSYYDYPEHHSSERKAALVTGLSIMLALSLTVAIALTACAHAISAGLLGSGSHADLVVLVAWTVPIATIANYLREVMRLRLQPWHYVTSATVGAVGAAAGGILAVLAFHAGIIGFFIGMLVGNGLAALYGLPVVGRHLIGRFSGSELRRMVHYGAPLVPAAVSLWGLTFLDRIMLSHLGSFSDTGEYAVGSRYASLLMFALTMFMTAYVPFMMSLWSEDAETERQLRARLLTYIAVAFVTGGLVISLFSSEITSILAPRFDQSFRIVGMLCAGVAFYAIGSLAAAGITLARKTKYIGIYTVAAVALNVTLNFLLIPAWGMIGAATATTSAYALLAALYYRKAQDVYRTPYLPKRAVTALLIGCPLMAVGTLSISPLGLAIAVKLGVIALFALAIWLRRVIDENELFALVALMRRFRAARRPVAAAAPPAVPLGEDMVVP